MRRKCTDALIRWKKKSDRKPLILQGGRQTGKTWILRDFGSRHYEDTIYINLETDRPVEEYLSVPRDAEEALLFLEAYANKPIREGTTLLILDGLQVLPEVSQLLADIALDFPGYHIAGIERGILGSYDSGDIEVMQLFPLDFEEFLWANKEYGLAKEIREHFLTMTPMGNILHQKAMAQFYLYMTIGGMPGSICEYRKEKKLLMVPDTQQKLLGLLQSDITAGAPEGLSRHCRNCWISIPSQLCKENGKFQYRQVVKGGTAKTYQAPLNWLTANGLAYRSPKRNGSLADSDSTSFRLYLPDCGLSACLLGLPSYILLTGEESRSANGIAETCLAQSFIRNGYHLSYWSSGNQAQVPFVLEKGSHFTAVDFRLTPHQKARNLSRIRELCGVERMFLVSPEDFKKKDVYCVVPFYAAFCI